MSTSNIVNFSFFVENSGITTEEAKNYFYGSNQKPYLGRGITVFNLDRPIKEWRIPTEHAKEFVRKIENQKAISGG